MSSDYGSKVLEHALTGGGPIVTPRRVGETAIRILEIVAGAHSQEEAARRVADAIRDTLGFESVWFRLRRGGDFPILVSRDTPGEILKHCNMLRTADASGLTCLCGSVLDERHDTADQPGYTERGAFWTGSIGGMIADGCYGSVGVGYRHYCHMNGFKTQVVLPLKAHGETIGLMQLCDRRRDLVDGEIVEQLEDLARGLAHALVSLEKDRYSEGIEGDLRTTEIWFRAITDFATDVIAVIDVEGVVNFISPSVMRELGRQAHSLIDGNICDLVHPEDLARSKEPMEVVLQRSGSRHFLEAVRLRHADGEYRYFDIGAMSAVGEEHIDGIVISARNVTEQVRGRRELATFKAIHEAAAYGSVIVDPQGDILYLNQAYAEITGYERDDLLGRNLYQLIVPGDLPSAEAMQEQLVREGHVPAWELRHLRRDGTVFWGLVSFAAVRDEAGEVDYYAANLIDISDKKRAEGELQDLNLELESRVEVRTRELDETRDRLVETEKQTALSGLLTGFAHEINTPLGISITAASLLYDRVMVNKGLERPDAGFLTLCGDSSRLICLNLKRVAELVNTFKRLSPDQIAERPREIALREHIIAAAIEYMERFYAAGHTLDIDCPDELRVFIRPDNFALVIGELVLNSLDHGFVGREGGQVTIGTEVADGVLTLIYSDDGVGINEATRARIFDPFFTTRRDRTGTGLGMHIVHNLVTRSLNGAIEFDGALGEGVRVTLRLPVVPTDG